MNDLGLDLGGFVLREARAISDDGRTIVGYGENVCGIGDGWIAVIPEPSSGMLLGAGLLALGAYGNRRASARARRASRA